MNPEVGLLVAAFTAIATAVGWFFRGQIRNTNADKLWDVSEGMRKEQAKEILDQRKEIRDLEARVTTLEAELRGAKEELRVAKEEGDKLLSQVERFSHENDRLRDHINRLLNGSDTK